MITNKYFFEKYKKHVTRIQLRNKYSNIICLNGKLKKLYIIRGQRDIISKYFNESDIFIKFETWYNNHKYIENIREKYFPNVYKFTNSKEFEDIEKNIYHIHHDISLPLDVFNIKKNIKKKELGITTSSFQPYKNIHLLKNNHYMVIQNKINYDVVNKYNLLISEYPKRVNDVYKLNDILNEYCFGGIFSTIEGGCNSSVEYLACGLPVLSTYCKGGRETWYNENNSILCEPDENIIKEKCKEIIEKYNDNVFDSIQIRENLIKDLNIHKNKFKTLLFELLDEIKINLDHNELIKDILSLRYIAR